MKGESELLDWLRGILDEPGYLGDDAARIRIGDRELAVTVDSQIEGVHVPDGTDPSVVARRLLAVNLSDLAAVGARPTFGFLALDAPSDYPHRRFLAAFAEAAREAGVILAGGDLAATDRLTASLTLLGDLGSEASWPGRDRARAGDLLWVGGSLGESVSGRLLLERGGRWNVDLDDVAPPGDLSGDLADAAARAIRRHLVPTPQLDLGQRLAERQRVACLDLSDGLARDLHRILRASGVGAEIEAERLPAADGAPDLALFLGKDLLDLQLYGGEDYVLLFALPSDEDPPPGCHRLGRIVEGSGARIRVDGEWRDLPDRGWDHLGRDQEVASRPSPVCRKREPS